MIARQCADDQSVLIKKVAQLLCGNPFNGLVFKLGLVELLLAVTGDWNLWEYLQGSNQMKTYQNKTGIQRQGAFLAVVLFVALILGCVSGRQEISQSIYSGSGNIPVNSIDAVTSAERQWHNGDIIYVANGYIDHMAIIDDSTYAADNSPDVIDTDRQGAIRRHNDFDKWADSGGWALIEGYYVARTESAAKANLELLASGDLQSPSANRFNMGVVYNAQAEIDLVPDLYKRNSPPNTHSSQLVRHAYKYLYDVDLDSNGGWWSWPKDIRENTHVKAIPGASFARF